MTDYFVWIDPFEEIERQKRYAMNAREDGRRDVLRVIEGENREEFFERLGQCVHSVAHKIAREIIEPRLRDSYRIGEDIRRIEENTIRVLNYHARPMISAMAGPGQMDLSIESPVYMDRDFAEPMMRISVQTIQPVRYRIQAPMGDRW